MLTYLKGDLLSSPAQVQVNTYGNPLKNGYCCSRQKNIGEIRQEWNISKADFKNLLIIMKGLVLCR